MIFPLNTLYHDFNSINCLYCEIIKGGLVNLVVSGKKIILVLFMEKILNINANLVKLIIIINKYYIY